MSFTIFQPNTYIEADEMNDNFFWVGQGDLLPRSDNSLSATANSLFDLGSDTYKWNNIYVKSLEGMGYASAGAWQLIVDQTITSNTTILTISGLNGDVDMMYMISAIIVYNTLTAYPVINYNNDTTTTYSIQQYKHTVNTLADAAGITLTSGIAGFVNLTITVNAINAYNGLIYAHTGSYRMSLFEYMSYCSTAAQRPYVSGQYFSGCMWSNTSSTITSLNFKVGYPAAIASGMLTGSQIKIWAKR